MKIIGTVPDKVIDAGQIEHCFFDKTGTLTNLEMQSINFFCKEKIC